MSHSKAWTTVLLLEYITDRALSFYTIVLLISMGGSPVFCTAHSHALGRQQGQLLRSTRSFVSVRTPQRGKM